MSRTGVAEPRGVLSIRPFRRLWIALSLSSLGDWLSILALTALAGSITDSSSPQAQSYVVGGVLVAKILPAVIFGPLAGAVANWFDRRMTMVIADVLRFGLFLSIPLVGRLDWLLIATLLVECVTLMWIPAKDAAIPALVPGDRLGQANRLSLLATYGSAPVAGVLFSVLALISRALFDQSHQADLALYVNAVMFLVSATVIFTLRDIAARGAQRVRLPSVFRQIGVGREPGGPVTAVRGLVIGIVGAFAASGAVVGVAKVYVEALEGGNAGYGAVFAALFLGLAFGVFLGPRMLRGLSRRRLFGLAVMSTGLVLVLIALIQNLVVVVFVTTFLGMGSGVSWITAHTMLSREDDDDSAARVFAFLRSLVRVALLCVLAIVPLLAGVIGVHRIEFGEAAYRFDGANAVLLITAVVAMLCGAIAYRQVDDRRGVPLARDLLAALSGVPYVSPEPVTGRGVLIAFEGGEGAGKTTQARLAAIWLRDHGYEVVTTQEPGATKIGMRLRAILLDRETTGLSARAETLLYAADRADHVATVIRPALRRGAIVVTDRYVDSSLAYQGYGRDLPVGEIAQVNQWATSGLLPDLTVILDVPAEVGLGRFASPADRIESEPQEFHERVRRGFRALAEAEPHRYLLVDARQSQAEITREIQDRVRDILPDPIPFGTEDVTSTFPAITDA